MADTTLEPAHAREYFTSVCVRPVHAMKRQTSPYRRSFTYRAAQLAAWVAELRGTAPQLDGDWLEQQALAIAGRPSWAQRFETRCTGCSTVCSVTQG